MQDLALFDREKPIIEKRKQSQKTDGFGRCCIGNDLYNFVRQKELEMNPNLRATFSHYDIVV